MPPGGDGDLHLGADRVGAGGEHGPIGRAGIEREEAAERADPTQHLGAVGRCDGAPYQADGAVALVDIDASVGVAEVSHVESVSAAGSPTR